MEVDHYKYIPILSIKPSEMAALEELAEKEKDLLLPIFVLKRWAGANSFDKTMARINKAFKQRLWIADIDTDYMELISNIKPKSEKEIVIKEFKDLYKSENGYHNWCDFISKNENLIPSLQLSDISQLKQQIKSLKLLNRPIVARLKFTEKNKSLPIELNDILSIIHKIKVDKLIIILDNGDINRMELIAYEKLSVFVNRLYELFPEAIFSISGTSFPYSFSGAYKGEVPIYERQLFNKILNNFNGDKLIYSDWASTREHPVGGGGGLPIPPRIDYPLKNDWRFVRMEFDKTSPEEKEFLYKKVAKTIMESDYWVENLPAWGRQMIEKTALGDKYGIISTSKATAVRVNLHLYQQLHYDSLEEDIDNEDDWSD